MLHLRERYRPVTALSIMHLLVFKTRRRNAATHAHQTHPIILHGEFRNKIKLCEFRYRKSKLVPVHTVAWSVCCFTSLSLSAEIPADLSRDTSTEA